MIEFDHQAYLIVGGGRESARDFVCRSCEEFLGLPAGPVAGAPLVSYPDFNEWQGGTYGIDEARDLRTKQNRSATTDQAKFFLVIADSFTAEAQNALLKTLEEPTANTFIFLVVPSAQNILPTLLSRVEVILPPIGEMWANELVNLANKFLTAKIPERLELIETIIGKEHPDRALARVFVAELAKALRQKTNPKTWTKEQTFAAGELIKAEKYLGEPASLAKMILEHLALVLPAC